MWWWWYNIKYLDTSILEYTLEAMTTCTYVSCRPLEPMVGTNSYFQCTLQLQKNNDAMHLIVRFITPT